MQPNNSARRAEINRKTNETDISLTLSLDGTGQNDIQTGIGFFDHMLLALSLHAGWDLRLRAAGDLAVDSHHTIEDVGICLGKALAKALSCAPGIARYGYFILPMDESLALCSLDVSGRAYLAFDATFQSSMLGGMQTEMIAEFFRAFAFHAGITLHLRLLAGTNDHHKAEALFKACAHALRMALAEKPGTLSTKGMLDRLEGKP